jgi:hypothetical protein
MPHRQKKQTNFNLIELQGLADWSKVAGGTVTCKAVSAGLVCSIHMRIEKLNAPPYVRRGGGHPPNPQLADFVGPFNPGDVSFESLILKIIFWQSNGSGFSLHEPIDEFRARGVWRQAPAEFSSVLPSGYGWLTILD